MKRDEMGYRVFDCRCTRGIFRLAVGESPKYKRCPRCLAKEQAALTRSLVRIAQTSGERRLVRRFLRTTEDLMIQAIRQG